MTSERQPALAFDMYGTLVDPTTVERRLCSYVDGAERAALLARRWRDKQLEFTWRLSLMGQYRDFEWLTLRALYYVARSAEVRLDEAAQDDLMSAYGELELFPDAERTLKELRELGYEMAVLSNANPAMLERVMDAQGLGVFFQDAISVDEVGTFKPVPVVYEHAAARLDRPLSDIRLVSANQFDVVGAGQAGTPAVWVNRSGEPFEGLGPEPHAEVTTLSELPEALSRAS